MQVAKYPFLILQNHKNSKIKVVADSSGQIAMTLPVVTLGDISPTLTIVLEPIQT